jgi:hypothetical protein
MCHDALRFIQWKITANNITFISGVFMKSRLIYIGFAAFALALAAFVGCARPPIAEMDSAREAVFAAENDAEAVQYGTSSLERARTALRNMEDAANSKRYDAAKVFAEEAIAAAEKAKTDGRAAAVRIREEAASNLSSLRSEIEETSINVNGARYSQLDLDHDALDRGIRDAYVTYDQAEGSMSAGMYRDALDKAMTVRANLADINLKITNATPRRK